MTTMKEYAMEKDLSFSTMMKLWKHKIHKTFDDFINSDRVHAYNVGDVLIRKQYSRVFVVTGYDESTHFYTLVCTDPDTGKVDKQWSDEDVRNDGFVYTNDKLTISDDWDYAFTKMNFTPGEDK